MMQVNYFPYSSVVFKYSSHGIIYPVGTAFSEYSGSAIDDSGIDYLGCMYKSFGNSTPYIKVPPSTQIVWNSVRQYHTFYLLDGNFNTITTYNSYQGERTITTTPTTRVVKLNLYSASHIYQTYVKNKNTGEYYFNGAEYTD